ncbi:hypothetical protein AB0M43_38630 [Longispora sp. NPDC051575]|uniref:hypothetical protein n=1 Tax=Longispora sp. NPDC051575 TaxID=3154943 RepID=UPI00342702B3
MSTPGLLLEHHDAANAPKMLDLMVPVYAASHADIIAADPFFHPDKFRERFDSHIQGAGFELVTGTLDGQLIGYAYGCRRVADRASAIWDKIRANLPGFPTPAEPEPIFIFMEFAVDPGMQGQGHGHAIHNALLAGRREPIANLFVRPENPARNKYMRWGWQQLAREKGPFDDAPIFDSLIKSLS